MNINIDTTKQYPPTVSHYEELKRYGDLYAGRTLGKSDDVLTPDPDLADASSEQNKERRKVRSNITADIAADIASMVVGEGITIRTPEEDFTQTLELLGFDNTVLQITETASVFGGAYVKINYDPSINVVPEIVITPPTHAAPLFVGNTLVSVTMWQTVKIAGSVVWRWVEHRDNQNRIITNFLYEGTTASWGARKPLDSLTETAALEETQTFPVGVNRLVWYVPNKLPNRRHAQSPQGRSDFAGSESLIATTDLLYTSLVRDVRLGRQRLVVPVDALTNTVGHGKVWDNERELYTTLDIDPTSEAGKPQMLQGTIRTQEHIDAVMNVIGRIVSAAGLAPVSFGLGQYDTATSGTALLIKEGKTISTVNAKRRYLKPVLLDLVATVSTLLGKPLNPLLVSVDFPPVRREAGSDLARTIQTLTLAGVMSVETAIRTVHPDWADEQVQEEVARIREDQGRTINLPEQF